MSNKTKQLHKSGEDYLEAILILTKRIGMVRSTDLADFMGYTKASISRAVSILKKDGFLIVADDGSLWLTANGKEIAQKIYARHNFFRDTLIEAGVDPKTADNEACQLEHVISEESFERLKEHTLTSNILVGNKRKMS